MLQDRAMLCKLSLSTWTGERVDNGLALETSRAKRADDGAVSATIRMVPQHHLKPIRRIDTAIRTAHAFHTLPWTDEGLRILPTSVFFEHSKIIGGLLQDRETAVNTFLRHYPTIREDAKIHLGDLYDEDLWPRSISARFRADITHLPIPSGEDFRVQMDESDLAKIRAGVETSVRDQVHEAMGAVRLRIHAVLQDFVDRVKDYKLETGPDGRVKATGVFRNSIMDNLNRLADILPKLNLTDDPTVNAAAVDIKRVITSHSVDSLRDDDALRRNVLDEANKLLSKFGKRA